MKIYYYYFFFHYKMQQRNISCDKIYFNSPRTNIDDGYLIEHVDGDLVFRRDCYDPALNGIPYMKVSDHPIPGNHHEVNTEGQWSHGVFERNPTNNFTIHGNTYINPEDVVDDGFSLQLGLNIYGRDPLDMPPVPPFFPLGVDPVTNQWGIVISGSKYKENIVEIPVNYDLLNAKVYNYNLKTLPTVTSIGLIADELEAIDPKLITKNNEDEITNYDTRGVIALLLGIIKDMNTRLTNLENV